MIDLSKLEIFTDKLSESRIFLEKISLIVFKKMKEKITLEKYFCELFQDYSQNSFQKQFDKTKA